MNQITKVDYIDLLSGPTGETLVEKQARLLQKLPDVWRVEYLKMSPGETDIYIVRHGSFQYMFDNYTMLEASGKVPYNPNRESRLVVAFGYSKPQRIPRDDFRLKGWVGPTEQLFGAECDKGHFIAHSIGGTVDQCELNVFVQNRRLNRGWSAEGKKYVLMEKYCFSTPNTFCFSRPIYTDGFAKPAMLEFGVLKAGGELWVETFNNQ